ncbi:hypothetical protein [Geothrix fuzhouensis]|uniref:hypothetical protein n=1 Tax=Geothrix fuzhouensis TaxID=2966451 RepID=UPI0021478C85|nr:hypothetical protein [Geothrix fuzhouensis]
MTKVWKDPRWNKQWLEWDDIPSEFRAALIWAFLTTGPETKDEFAKMFIAMEQWKYSRFKIFLELEILWINNTLDMLCDDIEGIDICRGISMFFSKKLGNEYSIEDRINLKKVNLVTPEMLKKIDIKKRDLSSSWNWMDSWFLKCHEKENSVSFLEWVPQELDRISKQDRVPKSQSTLSIRQKSSETEQHALLHLGRSFPIDTSGQEIQKTIRVVEGPEGPAMTWGYILRDIEPEIPYSPFPVYVSDWDADFNSRRFKHLLLREDDAFIGGKSGGLVDFPKDLRSAADLLRRRNRLESPMSHLVLG